MPGFVGKGVFALAVPGVLVNAVPFYPMQNQRLLTEGGGMRERIQVLAAETADLEVSSSGPDTWATPSASLSINEAGVCPPCRQQAPRGHQRVRRCP